MSGATVAAAAITLTGDDWRFVAKALEASSSHAELRKNVDGMATQRNLATYFRGEASATPKNEPVAIRVSDYACLVVRDALAQQQAALSSIGVIGLARRADDLGAAFLRVAL